MIITVLGRREDNYKAIPIFRYLFPKQFFFHPHISLLEKKRKLTTDNKKIYKISWLF